MIVLQLILFCALFKENAQNHCNVGNGKIVLDTISDWIQSIDAEAMER